MTRIFLNTQGRIKDGVSEELIQMLKYFENTTKETADESQSEKIRQLEKRVEETKANEEVGIRFMNAFEEKMRERQEGREEVLRKASGLVRLEESHWAKLPSSRRLPERCWRKDWI